jgi:hypothetical protein
VGNLHFSNVSGCFGLISNGDAGALTTYAASSAHKTAIPERDRRRGGEGSNTCSIT